jgi:anti-sigma-K factor RskA
MSDGTFGSECGSVLDYLSGACSWEEREAFELHLTHCKSCREELAALQIVWEALPLDIERIEPPQDLKEQIMSTARRVPRRPATSRKTNWRKPIIAVAAAAVIFFSGSLWHNPLINNRQTSPPSIENALFAPASRIVQINMLKAESSEKERAYGVACIVDTGQSKQFVVYVFGAKPTKDEQAYQVWLLRDGSRTSAGTFRVDEKGIGLLTMAIESDELNYDRIGITLEPDDKGDQPRGPKAFGTEAAIT